MVFLLVEKGCWWHPRQAAMLRSAFTVAPNISSEIYEINFIVTQHRLGDHKFGSLCRYSCRLSLFSDTEGDRGMPFRSRFIFRMSWHLLFYPGTPVCYGDAGPAMLAEDNKFAGRVVISLRIIASGVVFAFLYFASSIVMTLLLAVVLAYFLDPVVEFLERMHVPRGLGALTALLAVMVLLGGLGFLVADRADQFAADWPRYSAVLGHAATAVDRKLSSVENQVEGITPGGATERQPLRAAGGSRVSDLLFLGVGSLYSVLLVATFLPFLVFFMLAAKPQIWKATMELFPSGKRTRVKEALDQVSVMLRGYLAGNALVALILMLASWAFFLMIHLDFPFLAGCVSGLLNLVPYLGVVLAWLPPIIVGMVKWTTIGPFLGIAATLTFLHILGLNVLMPAIVGRRVHLNPLAVTIALLLWGWLWGAIGLILAIPITATIKVICDHVEGWEPAGRWLGA
jgi:predicted PurR-regulated permease PerM